MCSNSAAASGASSCQFLNNNGSRMSSKSLQITRQIRTDKDRERERECVCVCLKHSLVCSYQQCLVLLFFLEVILERLPDNRHKYGHKMLRFLSDTELPGRVVKVWESGARALNMSRNLEQDVGVQ